MKPGLLKPYMGALLRIAHDQVWRRMLREVAAAGFDDLSDTEYRLFQYPGPEGARPIKLAQRCGMTKQAMNYVLAGLERKGYLARRPAPDRSGRVIHLEKRGQKLIAALRGSVQRIEREWSTQVGETRLEEIRQHIIRFAQSLGWRA